MINGTGGWLGAFSALSTFGPDTMLTMYAGQATKDTPSDPFSNNTAAQDLGFVETPNRVPEPPTVIATGAMIADLALRRRSTTAS